MTPFGHNFGHNVVCQSVTKRSFLLARGALKGLYQQLLVSFYVNSPKWFRAAATYFKSDLYISIKTGSTL